MFLCMQRIHLAHMNRRVALATIAAAPAALLLPHAVQAGNTDAICAPSGLALRGADTVAYFSDGTHLQGQADHALMWRGAIWHFDRTETMAAFEMDPLAYCPQFGGYCALAMSYGMISNCDPRAFLVHDGALYLCSSPLAMARLRRDVPGRLAAARANWPAILDG
jgi:hypothetical protein